MKRAVIDYDIVIIGGGMVGLTCALALASASKQPRIAIVEPTPVSIAHDNKDYDLRVVALTRASQRMFEKLGCWQDIVKHRVSPYQGMLVWDEQGDGVLEFDSATLREPNLGHIVENKVIQQILWQHIKQQKTIDVLCDKLVNAVVEKDRVTVHLEKTMITSQLLVGADGGRSKVRTLANMDTIHWPYQQHALVCHVVTEKPHQAIARQRFLNTGPLAFLPFKHPQHSSIVWSTTPELAEQLKTMEIAAFRQQLTTAIDYCLGDIVEVSSRATFPLHMLHAKTYSQSRVVLIGDAAHTIHPLAGQGANLGLLDAACLSEVITSAMQKKQDIGQHHVLRKYERWRKSHNVFMLASMEGFKQIFSNDYAGVSCIRNMGLKMVNRSSVVKEEILQYALGLKGDLPLLANPPSL